MRAHGSESMWRRPLCRCTDCRTVRAAYFSAYRVERAKRLAADPAAAEHGTNSTYNNWRCRCEPCRAAHSVQMAARPARRKRGAQ